MYRFLEAVEKVCGQWQSRRMKQRERARINDIVSCARRIQFLNPSGK